MDASNSAVLGLLGTIIAVCSIQLYADELGAGVRAATTEGQRVVETTLGSCVEDVAAAEVAPPALIGLGDVVRLRAGLDWMGALAGRVLEADPLGTRADRRAG